MASKNELRAIYSAVFHAKNVTELVDCYGGISVGGFRTEELRKMFYELNTITIKLSELMETAEV